MRRFFLGILIVLVFCPSLVGAQETLGKTFQVERFELDPVLPRNIWHVSRTNLLGHLNPSGTMSAHFAEGQLQLDGNNTPQSLVASKLQGEISLGIGLFDWVELGVALPIVFFQASDLSGFGQLPDEEDTRLTTIGDVRIVPKLRIIHSDWAGGFGIAASAKIYLPISDAEHFESDGEVRVSPNLILDWSHHVGFSIAVNIGYDMRPDHGVLDFEDKDNLRYGLGIVLPTFWRPLSLMGNVYGDIDIENPEFGKRRDEPMEFMAGLQANLPENVSLALGGGAGLNKAIGSPKYRIFLAMGYAPGAQDRDDDGILDDDDRCPLEKEDMDGDRDFDGCPDEDSDGDGIEDDVDECPTQPEDIDEFEDKNGCPDYDNDNDGIVDLSDKCPNVAGPVSNGGCPINDSDGDGIVDPEDQCPNDPEDKDGFDDQDGCPDLDDDYDGVPDKTDKCRRVAEDKDGFQDEDGCPDEDNDADGIKDVDDRCPNDAETFNSFEDEDGCPDKKQSRVKVGKNKLIITEKIYFKTGSDQIQSRSYSILNDISDVLKSNPQIKKIRIEGHTDSKGSASKNESLSQRRSESVMDYLAGKGISPSRLDARGFGEERPIDSNSTSTGRANNRRVEFKIQK